MSDFADFRIEGRAALLAGRATHDSPMVEGARRWGAAAVLRPSGEVLDRLAALAGTIEAPRRCARPSSATPTTWP
ncbi:hypothetical protein ACWEPL_26310 [Nonomuraea sp. NPDC004186]